MSSKAHRIDSCPHYGFDAFSTIYTKTFESDRICTLWRKLNSLCMLRTHPPSPAILPVIAYMICMRFQIDSFSMKTLSVLAWTEGLNRHRNVCVLGEQGWRSGESTRLPPMWPGFKSWCRRHMWVEIVVGSLPCSERFFIGYSAFPLSLKTNTSKFRFDLEPTDTFQRVLMNS